MIRVLSVKGWERVIVVQFDQGREDRAELMTVRSILNIDVKLARIDVLISYLDLASTE